MTVRARKIKSIITADGEVHEGEALERLLADPARRQEFPDPTPMAPPIGYVQGPSLIEQMRMMVRTEMSRQAEADQLETFEEAEDFDVDDDYDPTSPWEEVFEPEFQEPPRSGPAVQPGDPVPTPTPTPEPAPTPPAANPEAPPK